MAQGEFDDPQFLVRLRAGESRAYNLLVRRYHGTLVGVASSIIGSRAQAEEVVQDTWIAVLNGIGNFEGRSSLSTWLFSIVLNRARTRIGREGRLVALPAVLDGAQPGERAVSTTEFVPNGHWVATPSLWDELDPERIISGRQLWEHVLEVIETLPAGQKAVLVMRDMEGQSADDACDLLSISPENQRVLLHRARGRVRKAIDDLVGTPARASIRPAGARAAENRPGASAGPVARLVIGVARYGQRAWCWLVAGPAHDIAATRAIPRSFCSRTTASGR